MTNLVVLWHIYLRVLYKEIYFVISILYCTTGHCQYSTSKRNVLTFLLWILFIYYFIGGQYGQSKQKRHLAIFINGNWLLLGIRIRVCSFLVILWFLEEFSYAMGLSALVSLELRCDFLTQIELWSIFLQYKEIWRTLTPHQYTSSSKHKYSPERKCSTPHTVITEWQRINRQSQ